jgi:hypothetical protein
MSNNGRPHINPRFLFPAPGWKCFECRIDNETDEACVVEHPVIGWGVVEGYDECEVSDGSEMELLVTVPQEDYPYEAPIVYHASDLPKSRSSWGFVHGSSGIDFEGRLVKQARANIARKSKTLVEVA